MPVDEAIVHAGDQKVRRAAQVLARPQRKEMQMMDGSMMGGGMMFGMGIWGLLILVLVILAILALVKYLRK